MTKVIGERHGRAKLTEKQVLGIKDRYSKGDVTQEVLAQEYGVARTTIGKILKGHRWTYLNDPGDEFTITPRVLHRFWSKVDKTGDCWTWIGSKDEGRYGMFILSGKIIKSHRFSYILSNGSIPKGLFICHTCDNPPCVNPDHLFAGTQKDNMEDMTSKGRSNKCKGSDNGRAKLTEDQVLSIRIEYSEGDTSHRILAEKYKVSKFIVTSIINRKLWNHI